MFEEVFGKALPLGFGLMRLPMLEDGKVDIEQLKEMVDLFMENGFTYFDTAWMYCGFQSEDAIKEALTKRYPRDSFTLTTKLHSGFIQTEEDRDKVFNAQREKTGVEYFDYYLVHDVNCHSIEVYDRLNVFDYVLKKKEEGLVKHVGFSFHDGPELLDKVLTDHPEMEFVQIQLNYLDYENPGVQSRACYEVAAKHGKPVIVMEPVKGGTLVNIGDEAKEVFASLGSDLSVASYAIRFAASHENVRMVLSGMSDVAQIKDNMSYMKDFRPLTAEERAAVQKVTDILSGENQIPCTACSYCTEGCPMSIPIPKYFGLYNAELKDNPDNSKGWTPQKEYYENIAKNAGKASDCIECGQCEGICPQHLEIISLLKNVKDRMEE